MLAGVSLDYYARLEQGRDLQPSDQVLDAIARALRLAEVQRAYLHNLVRSTVASPTPGDLELLPLAAGTRLMLDRFDGPAMIVDFRGEVHAMNRLGRAMLVGLEPMPSASSNHTRWLFLDPDARELLVDWEVIARHCVAVVRDAAGRHPQDKALQAVIGELAVGSPEFAAWWADHEVEARCQGLKRYRHPVVGELTAHIETLALPDGERWLFTYVVEPGSRSDDAIRLLGSWAATEDEVGGAAERLPTVHPRHPG